MFMMKKLFAIGVLAATVLLSSCKSSTAALTIAALEGEWNIVEINGAAVLPSSMTGDYPYMGFDTSSGRLSGNSGCNRMMGSFDASAKAGVLEFGPIAGTRMACPDMTLEQNVLNALKNIKGYKAIGAGENIALVNARNRPVVVLAPRQGQALISALQGEWMIVGVGGEAIPTTLEKKPFISFDLQAGRIHGVAGCNNFNGSLITEASNPRSISFPAVATTMMICPDMDTEDKISRALNQVKAYNILADGKVGLYGENGDLLLLLNKKA